MPETSFDSLDPESVVTAIERETGLVLDGTFRPYPSYVNRVYGLRAEDGTEYVAKFYRPGRWTREAVLDEHRFLMDCADTEIPAVAPLAFGGGRTLFLCRTREGTGAYPYALFPKKGGRNFDAETDDDWIRLGSLIGRLHSTGRMRKAENRIVLDPATVTAGFVAELVEGRHVHPKLKEDFLSVCSRTIALIAPLFCETSTIRLHGDCHRGNILDRPGEGLLLIDFDDMMNGPAVQDLWLLLPGYSGDCGREFGLLLDGYERFSPFDRSGFRLIEPLRFMRLIHFLAWRARQRHDHWFAAQFPDWGNEAFWIKEVEDLRVQAEVIRESE